MARFNIEVQVSVEEEYLTKTHMEEYVKGVFTPGMLYETPSGDGFIVTDLTIHDLEEVSDAPRA